MAPYVQHVCTGCVGMAGEAQVGQWVVGGCCWLDRPLSATLGFLFLDSQIGASHPGLALLPTVAGGRWSQRGSPPQGCPHLSLTEGCDPTLQHCHQCREGTLGARTWGLGGRGLGSA